jgi:hypothetical protein
VKEDVEKPEIKTYYNKNKISLDTLDQLIGNYTCS